MLNVFGRTSLRLLTLLSFTMLVPLQALADEPSADADRPTISVSGGAEIIVSPDQMVVSGSIESREKTVAAASAANAELVKSMRAAIKALEIPEKDVSTERISIRAIHESPTQSCSQFQRYRWCRAN